ncbi:MAG: nucleoside hydrolase [Geodermatophilaceae bacterium]|nr:nucleoside hydrolase [Geodermatophilaceae bacterium]MDQ3465068.1 nucleoside hydrolase [Actinomycetota bacterium]
MRIHLDTDLGGDPDDACALAMLLGWPDVEITGITTTIDPAGWRAAYVLHCLELAGRGGIPVAAGAAMSSTRREVAEPVIGDERYWPADIRPRPSAPGAALDLLQDSIKAGARLVAIGPYTNLGALELLRPGTLAGVEVVVMGGWVRPPREGLPAWGVERDFNVQWDTRAAQVLAGAAELTLVTLPATLQAPLRAADLPRLRRSGPLGELLARQSEAHAVDSGKANLGRKYRNLADDLLNFHYDPVACAVALDWPGAVVAGMTLAVVVEDGVLRWDSRPDGRPTRVVTEVNGPAFTETWLTAVEAAQAGG